MGRGAGRREGGSILDPTGSTGAQRRVQHRHLARRVRRWTGDRANGIPSFTRKHRARPAFVSLSIRRNAMSHRTMLEYARRVTRKEEEKKNNEICDPRDLIQRNSSTVVVPTVVCLVDEDRIAVKHRFTWQCRGTTPRRTIDDDDSVQIGRGDSIAVGAAVSLAILARVCRASGCSRL